MKKKSLTPRHTHELEELIRDLLSNELNKSWSPIQVDDQVLSAKEASAFLRISMPTLDRLVAENAIPHFRVGRNRRFLKSYLVQFGKTSMN
jgi:excisionase family DNA binding protein